MDCDVCISQFKLFSYLDCYVCISRNLSCLIWIVTFVSCAILAVFLFGLLRLYLAQFLAVFLFGLLRLYLAQFKLFSYLDCYVYISRNFICFFIWIVMFVSRAATAVILFGLLRLYLGQLQLSSCLGCYVCILRNLSSFFIWIVTFVSRNLSCFLI